MLNEQARNSAKTLAKLWNTAGETLQKLWRSDAFARKRHGDQLFGICRFSSEIEDGRRQPTIMRDYCNTLFLPLMLLGCVSASAQMQKAPRATLVATPTPTSPPVVVTKEDFDAVQVGELYYYQGQLLRKRSWSTAPAPSAAPSVVTSTPTSPPVVVTKEDYDAVPLGNPYWWKGQLYTKGTSPWQASVSTPAPASAPSQNDLAKASGTMFALLAIFAATIGFAIYRRNPKFTNDGLFVGQSPKFFRVLNQLAEEADAATREGWSARMLTDEGCNELLLD
jgi:hypothetical protein